MTSTIHCEAVFQEDPSYLDEGPGYTLDPQNHDKMKVVSTKHMGHDP